MKIDKRLNEEASGGGDQQPPWDPENPPFWWNPNVDLPPDFPHQYPLDLNGDGVISIVEWLHWVNSVAEAWREVGGEDNPNPVPDVYGDDPYGFAPWIGRGGLPDHIAHNPWWLLPPRGGDWDKSHPLYALYLEWIKYGDLADILFDILRMFSPAGLVGSGWRMFMDYILELFGVDGGEMSFDNFLAWLRFLWSPHVPSRWGRTPYIGKLILQLREWMLENLIGMEQFAELFGLLAAGEGGFHSVPYDENDPSMPGAPDLDGDGEPDLGIWYRVGDNWYWVPDGLLNPNQENPLDVPEVIDRPPQPEPSPPPDPFDFDPMGGPITPLASAQSVEGEFAKAFARYNGNMQGKGIR